LTCKGAYKVTSKVGSKNLVVFFKRVSCGPGPLLPPFLSNSHPVEDLATFGTFL